MAKATAARSKRAKAPRRSPKQEAAATVERIRERLRGDVAGIYGDLLPPFQGLPPQQVYDLILASPDVLDGCFQLFHAHRDAFAHLLVDADGATVESDTDRLACGRAVSDIMAMALRSMTHRYLRGRLGGPTRHRLPDPDDLRSQLASLFGHRPPPRYRTVPGPGDKLYEALRDVLRYEWQARLVPYYAPLPVPLVRNLGERLLDYRAPGDLEQLAADYAAGGVVARRGGAATIGAESGTVSFGGDGGGGSADAGPPATRGLSPRRSRTGGGLSAGQPVTTSNRRLGGMTEDDIWAIYAQSDLRKRLGQFGDDQQGRRLVALAAAVGPETGRMLTDGLHLNHLQMVAATCALAEIIGASRFLTLFADPGNPTARGLWHDALVASHLPSARTIDRVAEPARMAAMMAATEITAKRL